MINIAIVARGNGEQSSEYIEIFLSGCYNYRHSKLFLYRDLLNYYKRVGDE